MKAVDLKPGELFLRYTSGVVHMVECKELQYGAEDVTCRAVGVITETGFVPYSVPKLAYVWKQAECQKITLVERKGEA